MLRLLWLFHWTLQLFSVLWLFIVLAIFIFFFVLLIIRTKFISSPHEKCIRKCSRRAVTICTFRKDSSNFGFLFEYWSLKVLYYTFYLLYLPFPEDPLPLSCLAIATFIMQMVIYMDIINYKLVMRKRN